MSVKMSSVHTTLPCLPSSLQVQAFQVKKSSIRRQFPNISLKWESIKSRNHQSCSPVCLFGGSSKGKSDNGNEASPWKAIEKVMGTFKKDKSVEDVLKQQIEKKEYYAGDGGGGGKRPGGGGGDGEGFGEPGDESPSEVLEEIAQVILATLGFVFLYIYIIQGEEITVIVKDFLKFVFTRQKSIRLKRLINQWKDFLQSMKEEEYYDPVWLEREIISTPTVYDSPAKYKKLLAAITRSIAYDDGDGYPNDEDNADNDNDNDEDDHDDDDDYPNFR